MTQNPATLGQHDVDWTGIQAGQGRYPNRNEFGTKDWPCHVIPLTQTETKLVNESELDQVWQGSGT